MAGVDEASVDPVDFAGPVLDLRVSLAEHLLPGIEDPVLLDVVLVAHGRLVLASVVFQVGHEGALSRWSLGDSVCAGSECHQCDCC